MYQREAASLKEKVSKLSAVCLTVDCWTSRATTSFMAVTCHFIEDFKMSSCLLDCFEFSERHTADNLAKKLLNVAKDWKVEGKVVCCVTDNAANITKAIQIAKWTHLPCLAHTINLIARDSLKGLKPILDKVKEAVEYFHRSTVGAEKLKATQNQMGMAELRLKQDCITRWNSTYDMLKSFLKSKDAIISTLAITNASVSPLSQEEWSILQEVCTILEPFQEVTVEISAESYVTASMVILLAKGLQKVTVSYQRSATTQQASDLGNSLCANMASRFLRMEYNHTLGDATALDPRFKKVAFGDARAADEAFQRIATAAGRVTLSSSEPSQQPDQQEGAGSAAEGSVVWRYFHDRVAGAVSTRNPTADAIME
ncbi:hypothetical protein F7725_026466, partial [Dissostichus mawsoni]